jgi:hypothetical protein
MICSKKHNPGPYHSSVAQSPQRTLARGVFLCPAVFLLIAIGTFRATSQYASASMVPSTQSVAPPPPSAPAAQGSGQYVPPPPPPPPPPPGPLFTSEQLDSLTARIALYPDPLLAHILTASTYWSQIPEAAEWANEHSYLHHGNELADAIRADNLPWDPAGIALLPFPSILRMMAQDMNWTQQLGTAVLNQRAAVMDAVQRMRRQAYNYGYLRPNEYVSVRDDAGYIAIDPVNPEYIYVPEYDPTLVFAPPPLDLQLVPPYALDRRSSWAAPSPLGAGLMWDLPGAATTSSWTMRPGAGYGSIAGTTCIPTSILGYGRLHRASRSTGLSGGARKQGS